MTFTPLPGALDFSAQVAESLQPIGAPIAVNASFAGSVFDLVPTLPPNLQGLVLYWLPGGGSTSDLIAQVVVNSAITVGATRLTTQNSPSWYNMPLASSIVTSVPGTTCVITLNATAAGLFAIGTLFVFGMMANPVSTPVVRRAYIGAGSGSGRVNIGASSTQQLIPTPPAGFYYRLKLIGYTSVAAPGSANRISVRGLLGGLIIWEFVVPALANQYVATTLDLEWDSGLEVVNGTTSAAPMFCTYELWPL